MNDDFLSKFSGDKYKKEEQVPHPEITEKAKESKEEKSDIGQDYPQEKKPDPYVPITLKEAKKQEETFVKEEETEIDPSYKRRKRKRNILIASAAFVSIALVMVSAYFMTTVKLIDMTEKQVSEVKRWATENRLNLEIEAVYSLEYPSNTVISQNIEAGTRIMKKNTLIIQVSKGADPEQLVEVPDLAGKSLEEAKQWVVENKLDNVSFQNTFSDDIAKNVILNVIFSDKEVEASTYKRKHRLIVMVSAGKEVFEKNIKVLNFKGKTEGEIEAWHAEQKFIHDFIFEEVYDDKVMAGEVISQSLSADTLVSKDETLTFVISKGKALIVPRYYGDRSDFETISTGGLNVMIVDRYSDSVAYGYFMWQSIAAGTNLSDAPDTIIKVAYSLGRPYIERSLVLGLTPKGIEKFFFEMNAYGTSITYTIEYKSNCSITDEGKVYDVDKGDRYVNMKDHITVYVGRACNQIEGE